MVNLNADPPQGRQNSQQLRTTGRFSIPFISTPQGIDTGFPGPVTNGWINDLNSQFVDDLNNDMVFEL